MHPSSQIKTNQKINWEIYIRYFRIRIGERIVVTDRNYPKGKKREKRFEKKPETQKSRPKGLPKPKYGTQQKTFKSKKSKFPPRKPVLKETKFMPCNSTNIQLIKDYFETIEPRLYDILATSGKYVLYQYEGLSREIYLVPTTMTKYVKKFSRSRILPVVHAGIHLGYMRRAMTYTGFARAFFLSYEGGEFVYTLMKTEHPNMLGKIQVIQIDSTGEKSFLYGHDIEIDDVISEINHLQKKKLIFVKDQTKNYIGLALLIVKQAGSKKPGKDEFKTIDFHSRSPHFTLRLMNLTDAGYYLRKGG